MTNDETRDLALRLVEADDEVEVIETLTQAGLWQRPECWRLYGDDENNFKTIGNQQARPEPALVEKLVNSVDARLMAACVKEGIAPDSQDAPSTIRAATRRFFSSETRTTLAQGITLAITGARPQQQGMPCITICDVGEGQTPANVPNTFMSLDRTNKLRIPFVQGKFNMGGTGALMFCGKRKLQLLITRRDPAIARIERTQDSTAAKWAVTIVRRESPPEGPGQVRHPYFKYLAPVGADDAPGAGEVLSFEADELALMPEKKEPYVRRIGWGSCIKLYNYDMRGFKGNILRKGGLLPRLEILLPEVALPCRLHECRGGYGGHAGSYDTNLIGLKERLENSRSDNLEDGYPDSLTLNIQGQPMTARVYAFKGDRAESYRADQGIVFTINGQTHGWFPRSFFERKKVRMGRLAKSLMVMIDCTDISVEARADLFRNSRDRLSGGDLRRDIEEELELQIANHAGLRDLRERRRRDEVAERLKDSKPLEDVIGSIMKSSPSLSRLFLLGQRLSRPFRTGGNGSAGGTEGATPGGGEFKGLRHPTYFRFARLHAGEDLRRTSEHGRRCRVKFETDVENEYFVRDVDRGRYHVEVIDGVLEGQELTTSLNLHNGIANWSVHIPAEDAAPGDELVLQFTVADDVMGEQFVNVAKIVLSAHGTNGNGRGKREGGGGRGHAGTSGAGDGKGTAGGGAQQSDSGIELPEIKKVRAAQWADYDFDEKSACTIVDDGPADNSDGDRSAYTFYINVDNVCLQTDIKNGSEDPALLEAKFVYGNVLIGLALIHDQQQGSRNPTEQGTSADQDAPEVPLRSKVEVFTRALAPFLVPMIEYLGGLKDEHVTELAGVGDEE